MHLHYVHSIGIKLWRNISYNIPLKCKCFFRVKDNIRNIREWSFRKDFTDMVSCASGQWCYNFPHSEGLGMEDIWGNGKVFFLFLFFTKGFGCVAGTLSTWNDCGRGARKSNCIERPFVPDYGVLFCFVFFFGEGNGNPLHYSCLENPMDGGAWWAAVHGIAKSRRHWVTSLSLFTFMQWRRKWQPTPVFLPGESQGWESLVGCHLWGHTESDTTEAT